MANIVAKGPKEPVRFLRLRLKKRRDNEEYSMMLGEVILWSRTERHYDVVIKSNDKQLKPAGKTGFDIIVRQGR